MDIQAHVDRTSLSGEVVWLNVGGSIYATLKSTLLSCPGSIFSCHFQNNDFYFPLDAKGRIFIDRDGPLFRYILDYLRNGRLALPKNFKEHYQLMQEAEYFKFPAMVDQIKASKNSTDLPSGPADPNHENQKRGGFLSICVRSTYAFKCDGMIDVNFKKNYRIVICGDVTLAREVFGETLNETRSPDRAGKFYSNRCFLKHSCVEMALDQLHSAGFKLVGCCGGGAGYSSNDEESKWNHFKDFIFLREGS